MGCRTFSCAFAHRPHHEASTGVQPCQRGLKVPRATAVCQVSRDRSSIDEFITPGEFGDATQLASSEWNISLTRLHASSAALC